MTILLFADKFGRAIHYPPMPPTNAPENAKLHSHELHLLLDVQGRISLDREALQAKADVWSKTPLGLSG